MKIEFKEGITGCIDPWSLEKIISLGRSPIVTEDMAIWVRVENRRVFKVLPDTKSRIEAGEDPEKVFMDALQFWRPGMKTRLNLFDHNIEVGCGEIDPKTRWKYLASGKSYLTTNGRPGRAWVYYDECPPFPIDGDILDFLKDIKKADNEKELEEIITIWTWK